MIAMSLRLAILSCWTPKYIVRRELARVSELTTAALESLLEIHAPDALKRIPKQEEPSRSMNSRRSWMARRHVALVEALKDAIGEEETIALGRAALFEAGRSLGREAQYRLRMRRRIGDLVKAARILYRVLGIEFEIERSDGGATMRVYRCALSREYSELTCKVLSATDEGVIRGLDSRARMSFEERMTSGCQNCIAIIGFNTDR